MSVRTYEGITPYKEMLIVSLDVEKGDSFKQQGGLFVPNRMENQLTKAEVLAFGEGVDLPDNVRYVYLPDNFTVFQIDEQIRFVNKQSILGYEVDDA